MEKSKQAKASEGEDGVDKISNLSDGVLRLILSCIQTTEEVVRTSILSRRWRHLWTSIPSIDIDYTRGLDPFKKLDTNGFKEFVYWVLIKKPQDLDSFRLWCGDYYNMSTITQWIHLAVMRKVKLLDLMFLPIEKSHDVELPHCLVTCGSLKVLKLCLLGWSISLPKFTGFQGLRVLELNDVSLIEDGVVDYFLKNSPFLEDLSLINCIAYSSLGISSPKLKKLRIDTGFEFRDEEFIDDEFLDEFFDSDYRKRMTLEICCPKLEFLRLTGYVAEDFLFQDLDSLKKAVIHTKGLFISGAPSPLDFFARISRVESLSISLQCISECYDSDPRVDASVSLPNLKTLELTLDAMNMDALIKFLTCLPHLDSLHLIIPKDIRKWGLDEAATMMILTRSLKRVDFLEFDGEKEKLVLARSLLEHGNALEEMVFSWDCDEAKLCGMSMETMNEFLKFQKVFSNVKLRCAINPTQVNSRHQPQTKLIRVMGVGGTRVLKR